MSKFYLLNGEPFIPEAINPQLTRLANSVIKATKISFRFKLKSTSLQNALKSGNIEQMKQLIQKCFEKNGAIYENDMELSGVKIGDVDDSFFADKDDEMGLSPQGGLVMGTRSGDIDPTVIFHLHRVAGLPVSEIENSLIRHAGLLGLTGENDLRQVRRRRAAGDEGAALAFAVYCRRIREYVGAYLAVLGRVDAITFTAGVGENSPDVRAASLAGLEALGIAVDPGRNRRAEPVISPDGMPIAVCVVPTDEELEIAEQARAALTAPR